MSDTEFARQEKCTATDMGNELIANKGSSSSHAAHTAWAIAAQRRVSWDCAHLAHCFIVALSTAHHTKTRINICCMLKVF